MYKLIYEQKNQAIFDFDNKYKDSLTVYRLE